MGILFKLWTLFGSREKKKLLALLAMMIIAALFETAGIGLIVPFIDMVTDPNAIDDSALLTYIYETLNFHSINAFIIVATIMLFAFFVVKNLYLLAFITIQYRIIFNEQVKMSTRLFQAYMSKSYTFHLQRNSAQLLRNTNIEVQRVFNALITPILLIMTEVLVIACVLILLLILAPVATVLSSFVLGGSIFIFFNIFRKKLTEAALDQQRSQGKMIQWVNQGLGAVKEVRVLGREKFFVDAYSSAIVVFSNAFRYYSIIRQVPRLFIETIIVATILMIILLIMLQNSDLSTLLATISLFTMAAFRLMPSITRLVSAQTTIRNTIPALEVIYDDLILSKDSPLKSDEIIQNPLHVKNSGEKSFYKSIDLQHISYCYPEGHENAISNVSLSIPIDKSVAFVGPSGSGKTTIVDIILGVLDPTEGSVTVDGQEVNTIESIWKQNIGYIPQVIALSDDSIRNNIAFGIKSEEIDDAAIWRALEQAQLGEFVKSQPLQLNTFVGERGIRLSGGQRQRIGIARALYHNPTILFMDEATSSLDSETEREIMKAIDGLKGEKTLIIIAHRLSTIENCDIIFRMERGRLIGVEHVNLSNSIGG